MFKNYIKKYILLFFMHENAGPSPAVKFSCNFVWFIIKKKLHVYQLTVNWNKPGSMTYAACKCANATSGGFRNGHRPLIISSTKSLSYFHASQTWASTYPVTSSRPIRSAIALTRKSTLRASLWTESQEQARWRTSVSWSRLDRLYARPILGNSIVSQLWESRYIVGRDDPVLGTDITVKGNTFKPSIFVPVDFFITL